MSELLFKSSAFDVPFGQLMTPSRSTVILIVSCLCLLGCGGPSDKIKVSGGVTWNGEPVKQGFVSFRPLDSGHAPEAGPIRDGRFSFYARPGKNRVEIRATKEAGYNQAMKQPNYVQFIPPQYNDRSTLAEDVSSDGKNSFEFKLEGR